MRLLTGQPPVLATAARCYLAEIEEGGATVLVSNLVVMEAYLVKQAKSPLTRSLIPWGMG